MKNKLIIIFLMCILMCNMIGCTTKEELTLKESEITELESKNKELTAQIDKLESEVDEYKALEDEKSKKQESMDNISIYEKGASNCILYIKQGLISPNSLVIDAIHVKDAGDELLYCLDIQIETPLNGMVKNEAYISTDANGEISYTDEYPFTDSYYYVQPKYYDSEVVSEDLDIDRISEVMEILK